MELLGKSPNKLNLSTALYFKSLLAKSNLPSSLVNILPAMVTIVLVTWIQYNMMMGLTMSAVSACAQFTGASNALVVPVS